MSSEVPYCNLGRQVYGWICLGFLFFHVPSVIAADEWKAVFDPYQVLTLHLQMDTNDWERVRHDQPSQNESWVPEVAEALMWADGETPLRVTVRRKGESDTPLPEGDPQKVSLKIDVNALVDGQKWHGLNKLSLENGSENPLTEGFAWIAHRLAWEAGVYDYEAAYSGWVRLYINGELKGVFVNAEQRDAQFLRNHGYDKGPSTWLYKVDGSSALEVGVGHSPAYEHLCYPPFNSGASGGGGGGGCPQPNLEIDLPQWINIRGFFTLGAVEAFVENRDGLFTHSGKNSYAVDFDPPYPRTRLYFPWDQDTTIFQGNASIYGNEPYQTQLLSHPWFQKVYEQLLRDLIDGPFSVTSLLAVIDRIEVGVGPAFDEDPYVYGGNSAEAFDNLRAWVATRVPNVRSQLTQPYLPRPQFNHPGGEVVAGFNLMMSAPTGMVYYTLDGSDPRAPGGIVSGTARVYTAPIVIDKTTHVIARAFDGTVWSPLPATGTFNIARYASALRITELMYHPATQAVAGDEDNYEFVELKNTGGISLDLSGFYFEGINYSFPPGTIVAPNAFYVLARSRVAISNRYPGITVHGIYSGKLDDGGEKIRLRNSDGNTVISVEYDDDPPWPLAPDGLGYSLVLEEAFGDPDAPETWRASSEVHGSPGADDPAPAYGLGVVINEVLTHSDPPFEDAIELHNTGTNAVDISGWYLSDDFARTNAAGNYSLKKYRIAAGTIIPAGGFKVFYERDFRINNTLTPFALTEFGETVYLSGATAAGALNGYIMGARFGASDRGVSFGRYSTSRGIDFVPLSRTTFGADTPATLNDFRSGAGAANAPPRVGPVVINEIMYNPTGGGSEFIELLSITNGPVDLSGWTIAGANFSFPAGTVLPSSGLMLLLKTNTTTVAAFRSAWSVPEGVPIFGHDFVLENEGEALGLEKPNPEALMPAIEMERVRYNDKSPWPTEADGEGPSLERFAAAEYGNDPVNWRTVAAGGSPGRVNVFNAGVAIAKNSSWKYHAVGSNLGSPWREVEYADSGWPAGDGVLGYGATGLGTVLPYGANPTNKPVTVYFRKQFVINDPLSAIHNLRLDAMYDDGFVVYLNGTEVLRSSSMPGGAITFNTPAASSYNSVGYDVFDLSAHIPLLRLGNNVLAVEVHQVSSSSDDLLWDAALTFDVSTQPIAGVPIISPNGGSFTGPVEVSIATTPGDAKIYYTLNGTDPDESSPRYAAPFMVETSTQVRARAYKPGYNDSGIASAMFVFDGPGMLEVSPASGLTAAGTVSGPFVPPSITYVLTNSGGLPVSWTASVSQAWVSLSHSSGTLAAGSASNVMVSLNAGANSLPAGNHDAVVTFTTTNGTLVRSVQLTVNPIQMSLAPLLSGGTFEITLQGQSNVTYVIEASSNLLQWTPVGTNVVGPDGFLKYVESDSAMLPHRFYRGRPHR
ncbi:MAG: lamin tail domain-containing protein [Verrucomicrobia subdivision 3 bacterium]|nr:lamin tail domain-containing protein [Limisphaerales bacterium]